MKFVTKYTKADASRPRLKCGETKTDASFARECDIDRILYKYTHNLPLEQWQLNHREGVFADVSKMPKDPAELAGWLDNLNKVFTDLPADLRRDYGDDMFKFMQAMASDDNDVIKKATTKLEDFHAKYNPTLKQILEKNRAAFKEAALEAIKESKEANNETENVQS